MSVNYDRKKTDLVFFFSAKLLRAVVVMCKVHVLCIQITNIPISVRAKVCDCGMLAPGF